MSGYAPWFGCDAMVSDEDTAAPYGRASRQQPQAQPKIGRSSRQATPVKLGRASRQAVGRHSRQHTQKQSHQQSLSQPLHSTSLVGSILDDAIAAESTNSQAHQQTGGQTEKTAPFLPWSLPAALALMAGIILNYAALPWWVSLLWLAMGTLPLLFYKKYRWLPLLLLIPLGYGRMALWQGQANPLATYWGQRLMLEGNSDGRYLRITHIEGQATKTPTRVVMSPKDSVAAGHVSLQGVLQEARGKRNPGGFDYRGWLLRRGIKGQVYVEDIISMTPRQNLSLLERAQRGTSAGLAPATAGLMQAMTLGIRDDLGDLRQSFAAAGLAHILALSGLHVGVLALALGWLLRFLGPRRYPLIILIIAGFVLLVGASPSVLRAGLMVIFALFSLWLGAGRIDAWAALGLSALVILLYNPAYLFDLSFQLSYLAVAGMLIFVNPMTEKILGKDIGKLKWYDPRNFLIISMVVSIAAQLLSLPLVLSTFNALPLFSPLINVVAVPLASLLVPLGFATAVLGLFNVALAQGINLVLTGWLAQLLIWLAQLGAALPALHWGEIAPLGYAYYAIAILALALWLYDSLRLRYALLVLLACMLASQLTSSNTVPEAVFIDVGQGDSTLIRLPEGVEILMDAGGTPFSDFDIGAQTVVPALRALGVDELEIAIASHPDTDHIEGLISVLEHIPTQVLLIGHPAAGKAVFDKLMTATTKHNTEVLEVRRGERLILEHATLDILNPPQTPYAKDNDNSVVVVMTIHASGKKVLLLGDASTTVEQDLAFPEVDIILAGHHGSPSSTSAELLAAARPQQAVLSYGRNNYGHPAPEVRRRLEAAGVSIYDTFAHGAVRIPLD